MLRLGQSDRIVKNPPMFSAAKLTDDQKQALTRWAAEGASMADLQRRLQEEFNIGITYMDTRFLVLDLGLKLKEDEPKIDEKPEEAVEAPVPTGKVTVTIDELVLPGALVSGRVSFSDGQGGTWLIDQSGRPGLDPDTLGYRPSQEDIAEFQVQLRGLLEKRGY
jgi:hypothetical protein